MTQAFKTLRGTRDILPDEAARWQQVEHVARDVFHRYGFGEIRTPLIEPTALFTRSVGESTDIVRKEMYTFDRGSDSLSLRPENTASVARSFIQHSLGRDIAAGYPVRLYYMGPMFRYERPQAGRQRQFHQIGAEVLGSDAPAADAETICMLDRFLTEVGLDSKELVINSLGIPEEREAYRQALLRWVEPRIDKGHPDMERVWRENPLRLLDSKDPAIQSVVDGAPDMQSALGLESRRHFDRVLELLDRYEVSYRVDTKLVRGLDYYQRTVFEIVSGDLGAQNAVVGGGRYDGLIESLGGSAVPGFGFALGLERLLILLEGKLNVALRPDVAIIVLGKELDQAHQLGESLRRQGWSVSVPLAERPLGAQLKRAAKVGARFALFVGQDEIASGKFGWKDLESGEQIDADLSEIRTRLSRDRKDRTSS